MRSILIPLSSAHIPENKMVELIASPQLNNVVTTIGVITLVALVVVLIARNLINKSTKANISLVNSIDKQIENQGQLVNVLDDLVKQIYEMQLRDEEKTRVYTNYLNNATVKLEAMEKSYEKLVDQISSYNQSKRKEVRMNDSSKDEDGN